MGLLGGKNALVLGVANHNSIAWGIAQAFKLEGADVGLTYATERLENSVSSLAKSIGCGFVERCDVSKDEDIARLVGEANAAFGSIDILVHSIAFARRGELTGQFYNTTREGFHEAMDISVYSLVALVKALLPIMKQGGAVLAMSHHGSQQVFPNYNVMGVAKAALEASIRYLAADLGQQGIRVNAISAGPMNTLSARGIPGFVEMHTASRDIAPLRRNVTPDDIGKAAVYLCSGQSAAVTGQIHYVDAGLSTVAFAKGSEPNLGA
ncbi:enoyl-ACP reductase [Candidatus Woesearchaeota archaeon]|nr:enoyl-ACP reductase [Candidatus Woesearchaeota archaeon]